MNLEEGFSLASSTNMNRQLATVWGLLVDMFVHVCSFRANISGLLGTLNLTSC